ncbi:hypothetical protein L3V18_18095 [Lysobacter sp. TLK-CK17T]|uniref:Uncharacterized protein n=2 Tax=Marilutibacter chinensis TaxID=2912247 RepID=A0ABS9HZ66_9GAMM|nr:hypothetical protein [Lysobacter chinensis]
MLIAMSVLAWPAFIVLREGLSAGSGEAWMVLWMLAFVFVLPVTLLLLPSMAALADLARQRDNIPLAGVKIP